MIDPVGTVIEVQRVAPTSWWPLASGVAGGVVAGFFSLLAVRQTNKSNFDRMLKEKNFQEEKDEAARKYEREKDEALRAHDKEKDEKLRLQLIERQSNERTFELRKTAYVRAGIALRRASSHLVSLFSIDATDTKKIEGPLADALDSIDEVMLVGSPNAQRVASAMGEALGRSTIRLLGESAKCAKIKIDLSSQQKWHQEIYDAMAKRQVEMDTLDSSNPEHRLRYERLERRLSRELEKFEEISREISRLTALLQEATSEFLLAAANEVQPIHELRVEFLAATRADLGIEGETEWIMEAVKESTNRAREEFVRMNKALEEVYRDEDEDGNGQS